MKIYKIKSNLLIAIANDRAVVKALAFLLDYSDKRSVHRLIEENSRQLTQYAALEYLSRIYDIKIDEIIEETI